MSVSCRRDCTEAAEFRRETLRVEAEVREWMARDTRAASSVLACQDSGRLLAGMDVQARSLLDEEVKRTREQNALMKSSITGAKLQIREAQEKMMKVDAFAHMKELEEKVRNGRRQLELRRNGIVGGGVVGSSRVLLREDKVNWELFKKLVVCTAKAWKDRELTSKALVQVRRWSALAHACDELNRGVERMSQEQVACGEEVVRGARLESCAHLEKEETAFKEVRGAESGERRDVMVRRDYMKRGRELAGQAGDGCSQGGGSTSDFFTSPASPPDYVPPTPR